MESRLQSNEVRIPKTIVSSTSHLSGSGIPGGITSIAYPRIKSFETSHRTLTSSSGGGGASCPSSVMSMNGILSLSSSSSSSTSQPLADFDLSSPCQYFKSSFARSLSLNANQTKSLDFGINFGLSSRTSPIREETTLQTPVSYEQIEKFGNEYGFGNDIHRISTPPPPPLPLSQPPALNSLISTASSSSVMSSISSSGIKSNEIVSGTGYNPSITSNHSSNYSGGGGGNVMNNNINTSNSSFNRNVWSTSHKQNAQRRSFDSPEIEVLRLRKECQNLIEENRRLMGVASGCVGGNLVVPGNSPNIEAVILQTQVDTLQWQLKQVEASREMYRAVMEEVVRFLERCHRNLDSMQNEQIARSKSVHYVYHSDANDNNNPSVTSTSAPSPRARSSTNLVDAQKMMNTSTSSTKTNDESVVSLPATSYNNFRDFTWRRSPKRAISSQLATSECDPEKLSQEAFRLLRTAQNLLNTQEPDLTQPKHTIELQYTSSNSASPPLLAQTTIHNNNNNNNINNNNNNNNNGKTNKLQSPAHKQKSCQIDSESFCITFSRKMNMRESRLSLRSSTDGSVHSTSSSKTETDEENITPPNINQTSSACPTTEDESGFSSISSFQEIGLPMHSTLISPITHLNNSTTSDESGDLLPAENCVDSRNSTLKASQQSLMSSSIGLPTTLGYNKHRRWDSAPAVPPRNNLHVFSNKDETPTVLWV